MNVRSFVVFALVSAAGSAAAQEQVPEPPAAGEAAQAEAPPPAPLQLELPPPAITYMPTAVPVAPRIELVPRTRQNWSLLAPGIAMFAGGWLATWIGTSIWYGETTECMSTGWWGYTCTHNGPDDWALGWSFAPLIGPWWMLASDALEGADFVFPVIAGLVQATGLTLIIVGAVTGETVMVERPMRAGEPTISIAVRGTTLELTLRHL